MYLFLLVSNMSLWLDTNGPTGFKIKAQTRYMWPRVSSQKSILFPLTSVGNETFLELLIHNPSNTPVVYQAAMAQDYGPSWTNFVQDNVISGNITEGGLGNLIYFVPMYKFIIINLNNIFLLSNK